MPSYQAPSVLLNYWQMGSSLQIGHFPERNGLSSDDSEDRAVANKPCTILTEARQVVY